MEYRLATLEDVPQLVEARKLQLIDEGIAPDHEIDEACDEYLRRKLADGSIVEWVAEEEGKAVATAAIAFLELPPSYDNPSGVRGYITNMYTAPTHRGRGIATEMLGILMREARARGVRKVLLGASTLGRPVYERFGFRKSSSWMELDL